MGYCVLNTLKPGRLSIQHVAKDCPKFDAPTSTTIMLIFYVLYTTKSWRWTQGLMHILWCPLSPKIQLHPTHHHFLMSGWLTQYFCIQISPPWLTSLSPSVSSSIRPGDQISLLLNVVSAFLPFLRLCLLHLQSSLFFPLPWMLLSSHLLTWLDNELMSEKVL